MWQNEKNVISSQNYQRIFHGPAQGCLEDVLSKFPQKQYNTLIQHTNQLGIKPFHMVIDQDMQFWEVWGKKRFNVYVIEFYNITHHVQLLQHEEIHAALSQDDSRKHKTILECLPIPFCVKNTAQDIMFCNYAYAQLFNSTCVSVVAQQLRFDNPENPIPSQRHVKVALGGKLRSFKIQTSYLPFDGSTLETIWEETQALNLSKDNEETKKYFQDICQQLNVPIAIFTKNLTLDFWNKAYEQLFKFEEAFLERHPPFAEILDDLYSRQKLPEPPHFTSFKAKEIENVKNLEKTDVEIVHLPNGAILKHTRTPLLSGVIFTYEDITDTYQLKQQNKALSDLQKNTIDHLLEGILVFGSDYCVQLFNPVVQKLFNLTLTERFHVNDFLAQTDYMIPDMLSIFNQKHHTSGTVSKNNRIIDWTYIPLPQGCHMLRFVY